ncbi:MAG TPA: deaminase, partial [Agriterribacter sp.]|nr:deaminase [Agriterribacter sp.]
MNAQNDISRKNFIKNSALAMAGLTVTPGMPGLKVTTDNTPAAGKNRLSLKNVRLETGFIYEDGEVTATNTGLFYIEIENGNIAAMSPNQPNADAIDAKGYLMLPSFKDMHIHMDKTFYGESWQAARKRTGGVKGMIALEQKILPGMLKNSTFKAEKMMELLQSKGAGFARSHVNIEPTSKLESLAHLQQALENRKNSFGAELVAFP